MPSASLRCSGGSTGHSIPSPTTTGVVVVVVVISVVVSVPLISLPFPGNPVCRNPANWKSGRRIRRRGSTGSAYVPVLPDDLPPTRNVDVARGALCLVHDDRDRFPLPNLPGYATTTRWVPSCGPANKLPVTASPHRKPNPPTAQGRGGRQSVGLRAVLTDGAHFTRHVMGVHYPVHSATCAWSCALFPG